MPRLVDLKPAEVSLVGRAANKREFLLFKSEDAMSDTNPDTTEGDGKMNEEIQEVLAKEVEGEEELGTAEDAVAAYRLLSSLTDEAKEEVVAAAGLVAEEPTEKSAGTGEDEEDEVLKNASDEVREEIVALRKQVNEERERRVRGEFITKAEKEYVNIAEDHELLGELLKEANESLSDDSYELLTGLLKALDEQVEESEVMKVQGRTGAEETSDAMTALEKAADDLVEAGDAKTKQEAIALAAKRNPELADEAWSSE